jgi:hypothetical protein
MMYIASLSSPCDGCELSTTTRNTEVVMTEEPHAVVYGVLYEESQLGLIIDMPSGFRVVAKAKKRCPLMQ